MLSWRNGPLFENLRPPKKVFISHSYKDSDARQRLLAQLPRDVEPFVFPPITVPPEKMVSPWLLDAIRSCAGLIYLKGRASADSFWVALERDYALRQGKPVFAFDPANGSLTPDTSAPMTLSVHTVSSRRYFDIEDHISSQMRAMNFQIWDIGRSPDTVEERNERTLKAIERCIGLGGYVLVFWSKSALTSHVVASDIGLAARQYPDRIFFALLDGTELPTDWRVFIDPVRLYGQRGHIDVHALDDVIVRLYWLIYRNTRQNQLS